MSNNQQAPRKPLPQKDVKKHQSLARERCTYHITHLTLHKSTASKNPTPKAKKNCNRKNLHIPDPSHTHPLSHLHFLSHPLTCLPPSSILASVLKSPLRLAPHQRSSYSLIKSSLKLMPSSHVSGLPSFHCARYSTRTLPLLSTVARTPFSVSTCV